MRVAHSTVVLWRMGRATIVATATGTHKVGRGVDRVMADTTTGLFDVVGSDGFFNCFIPIWVVLHE